MESKKESPDAPVHAVVHTPEPWRVTTSKVSVVANNSIRISQATGPCAASCSVQSSIAAEMQANALLIAAAPDLLAACRLVLDAIEQANLGGEVLWIKRGSPVHESATDRLQAVIEKATGEVV